VYFQEVLCLDKTYNVAKFYVTGFWFKNNAFLNCNSNCNTPVQIAGALVHSNSRAEDYQKFLEALKCRLVKAAKTLNKTYRDPNVFGTDDDLASRKAIKLVFPNSRIVYCTVHLREALKHKEPRLKGCAVGSREMDQWIDINKQLFSTFDQENSFSNTSYVDMETWEKKSKELTDTVKNFNYEGLLKGLPSTFDRLRVNFQAMLDFPKMILYRWTNNTSESMNAQLKLRTEHEVKSLVQIIKILGEHIVAQSIHNDQAIKGYPTKYKVNTKITTYAGVARNRKWDVKEWGIEINKYNNTLPEMHVNMDVDRVTDLMSPIPASQGRKKNQRVRGHRKKRMVAEGRNFN